MQEVREQNKDQDFTDQIIAMLLSKNELYRIREKTVFDENNMKWVVPYFYLRGKEVVLPKINAKATVAKQREERDVVIETEGFSDDSTYE